METAVSLAPIVWPYAIGYLILGYLCGSIPFGIIFTRMAGLGDIRQIGSGNIGATNVLRTGHKGIAAATLVCDALKGTVAVLLAHWAALGLFPETVSVAGTGGALGAFLGHLYPVWLGFRGGKGVATFLGCLIGLDFYSALVFAAVWLLVALVSRYSSLAALTASIASILSLMYVSTSFTAGFAAAMALLLWWKHKDNIRRLLSGKEGRIGQKG